MRRDRPWLGALAPLNIICLLTLLLAACGAPAAQSAPDTPVRLQLSWVHEYSSASFYAAEKNGHFAEQGLAVTLIPGGFGANGYIEPIDKVLAGEVEFGLASATSVLAARAEGKPIVAVAAVFQRSPTAIITLADSAITRPQDLIGHTVSVAEGGAMMSYQALLQSQGIDQAQVTTLTRTTYGIEPLLNREVDGMVAWVINEGVQVGEQGRQVNIMLMSDYGVDTYDFLIIASEATVRDKPELVQRFVRASLQGIDDVLADPEQAIDYTLAYAPDLDRESQLRHLQASLPLIRPAGSQPGLMQPEIWEITYQMINAGAASDPPDLSQAYTNSFVGTPAE